jgi:Inner membrane protein YgaP-like, transmembrane domain
MNLDRLVFTMAGSFILLSVSLSVFHSPYWLFFTAFVGANLLQSSFTGFCPLAVLLKRAGVKTGHAFS